MTNEADVSKQADHLIDQLSQLLSGLMERLVISISQGEFGVLMFLSRHDKGVTSSTIARAMCIGPGGVANVLKALEQKGLVVKEQDRRDRRANCVRITDEGRMRLNRRLGYVRRYVVQNLNALGEEDSRQLVGLVERMLEISANLDYTADEQPDNLL